MMASGRGSGRARHEQELAKLLAKAVRNFDPSAPTIDERDMEREWEECLRHRLTAAEAAFRLRRRQRDRACDAPPLALLEPPGALSRAWAARKRQLRDAA
jgi:hypothetical protein